MTHRITRMLPKRRSHKVLPQSIRTLTRGAAQEVNKRLNRVSFTTLSAAIVLLCSFTSNGQLRIAEDGPKSSSQFNLAPNPSFEDGGNYPIGWEIEGRGEGTFRWKAARGRTDNHALSIRDIGAGSNLKWVTSTFIPIEPDHDYEISVWYRNTTQTSTVAFLAVFWGEDEYALGSTGIWQMKPTSEWTYRSSVIRGEHVKKSFPGANRIKLSFGGSVRSNDRGAIWIDDVALKDMTPPM